MSVSVFLRRICFWSHANIASWNSERICQEVERDYSEQLGFDLNQVLSQAASAIE